MDRILAGDYVGVSSENVVVNKDSYLKAAATEKYTGKFVSSKLDYVNYRHFGDTVLPGAELIKRADGSPDLRLIWTDVWMWRDGKWRSWRRRTMLCRRRRSSATWPAAIGNASLQDELCERLPALVAKAEKKGRTKAEVDEIIRWLTGYSQEQLDAADEQRTDFETFFGEAPGLNPARALIKGLVCGVRVEEIEEPLMREIRYLDKLIDELAKGKAMEKMLKHRSQVRNCTNWEAERRRSRPKVIH